MAQIPGNQRGVDPHLMEQFSRGTLDSPIVVSRPIVIEAARAAGRRSAAEVLGKIFLELRPEDQRLSDWALPMARTVMGERVLAYQLDRPTEIVLGADLDFPARIRTYDRHYEAVIPEVARQALLWGLKTLKEQSKSLRVLWTEIADESFAAWMHTASLEIEQQAADCLSRRAAAARGSGIYVDPRYASPAEQRKRAQELISYSKGCLLESAKSYVAANRKGMSSGEYLKPQVPFARTSLNLSLLQVLLAHPRFTDILRAYANSAAEGTSSAKQLIRQSYEAVDEFSSSLSGSPSIVWRYPVLILGGVQELGLSDLKGFRDYALAIGSVLAARSPEALLSYIGTGLFVLALVSGVGTGVALLDLAVGGANTLFTFVREYQQEQAVNASLFLPDRSKFALEFGYGETALGLAFMLLAAMSIVKLRAAAGRAKSSGGPVKSQGEVPRQGESARPARPSDITSRLPEEPKGQFITDANRGKGGPAVAKPANGQPAVAEPVGSSGSGKTGQSQTGAAATKTPPPAAPVADEFADLKLALNEGPRIANPTPDQVADAIKAFKKQLKRFAAEGQKAAEFSEFYLTPRQEQTFARLSDAVLTGGQRGVPQGLTGERALLFSESEAQAENLRRRLQSHWDAALPRRGKQTAEEAALELVTKLTTSPPEAGTLNNAIREKLFNAWRRRFLTRVARDEALIRDLEVRAGIVFGSEEAPSAFAVMARDRSGKFMYIGLDLDHAVIRHEDAVLRALRTNDTTLLRSTVDSANLQLMTARENRFFIEKLRDLDTRYWSVKSGPSPNAIQPFGKSIP